MKKFSLVIIFGFLLPLFCFSLASAEDPAPGPAKIDFHRTADYFREWESRKRFPENVPFGYYYAYSLKALGEKISPGVRDRIVGFIKDCQGESGGFSQGPAFKKTPNLVFTFYALKTLALLDSIGAVDAGKARDFVLGLAREDGGFKGSPGAGERTSLAMTFFAAESLKVLGGVDKLNREKIAVFVNRNAAREKGFSLEPNGLSTTQGTYMAAQILADVGFLTDDVKSGVVGYLKGTRYSGLAENVKYQTLPYMKAMAEVTSTLSLLSALSEVKTARMREFVESLYIGENGGFGPRPGLGTTPEDTFHAIVCLVRLGQLKDPEAPAPVPQKS
jgi:prenyltransferase beta subunit